MRQAENRNPGVMESVVVYVDGRFKESLDLLATERETVFEMSLRAFSVVNEHLNVRDADLSAG